MTNQISSLVRPDRLASISPTSLLPVHLGSQEDGANAPTQLTQVQAKSAANDLPYVGHHNLASVEKPIAIFSTEVEKPIIQVGAGMLEPILLAMEKCLAETGRYYQRGGFIVTVRTDPSSKESITQEVDNMSLLRDLDCAAYWERQDRRSGEWVRIDSPERYCSILVNARELKHLA